MPTISEQTPSAKELDKYIAAIAQNDLRALETLYKKTHTAVYAYALSLTRNREDAQDILQDCFIKVYESAHTYSSHGKAMSWILTIARNLALSRFRKYARNVPISDEVLANVFADTETSPEDRLVIMGCLEQLSEEERTIVVLHAVAGMKHRHIASHLGMPLPTVLSKYRRALKKLKNILTGEHSNERQRSKKQSE